jgi:hypothetical protein
MTTIEGSAEAAKLVSINTSPRARYLEQLESYVDGTQYEGLKDWFALNVPLFQKAPCFVYPIVRNAIDSNLDLLLGNSRWPTFKVEVDGAGADEVDTEDSEDAFDAVVEAHKQCRFRVVAKEAFAAGQACGSACAIFGVRNGKLVAETVRTAWCEPVIDADGNVVKLTIEYPYFEDFRDETGQWRRRTMLYRRVIDAKSDLTYKPVEARKAAPLPSEWHVDETRSVEDHGLEFCPVVWFAHMKGCRGVAEVDGRAIHKQLLDEVRAHDMAISQRHRAALYAGDPQWTETGVKKGYSPTPHGVIVEMPSTPRGGAPSAPVYDEQTGQLVGGGNNPITGNFISGGMGPDPGRKKGPSEVWQYDSKDARVELHTLPGDALKALTEHARDMRVKLAESFAVVFLDAETFKFATALSGKALELLQGRQLNRVDQYRDDFGDLFLVPATRMLLRIIAKVASDKTKKLRFPRIKDVLDQLSELDEADITLKWPPYFRADIQDESKEAKTVRDDLKAKVITRRTAVERRASHYGIEDVDAYMDKLDGELADGGGNEDDGNDHPPAKPDDPNDDSDDELDES